MMSSESAEQLCHLPAGKPPGGQARCAEQGHQRWRCCRAAPGTWCQGIWMKVDSFEIKNSVGHLWSLKWVLFFLSSHAS